jgi:hypothetical protein
MSQTLRNEKATLKGVAFMSVHFDPAQALADHKMVAAPTDPRACTERDFNLPVGLHVAYFGFFLGFLAVMWAGFANPNLAVPMVICVLFTAAFYVVPMLWSTMRGPNATTAMRMDRLWGNGIATFTGHSSGGAAVAQVLILPVLIFFWGVAVVTIAALV